MGDRVNVISIERLKEFSLQYRQFIDRLTISLEEIELNLWRQLEQLEEAYESRVQRLRELMRRYEESDELSHSLLAAQIQEAQERMTRIGSLLSEARFRYQQFHQMVHQILQFRDREAPKAVAFLESVVQDLEMYIAVSLPHSVPSQPSIELAGNTVRSGASQPVRPEQSATPDSSKKDDDKKLQDCRLCRGKGFIRRVPFNPERFEIVCNPDFKQPCPRCYGSGKQLSKR